MVRKRDPNEPYLITTIRGTEWTTDCEERQKQCMALTLLLGIMSAVAIPLIVIVIMYRLSMPRLSDAMMYRLEKATIGTVLEMGKHSPSRYIVYWKSDLDKRRLLSCGEARPTTKTVRLCSWPESGWVTNIVYPTDTGYQDASRSCPAIRQ